MTQEAVVISTFPSTEMAEVSVLRGTACGGNCGSCEVCAYQNELRTPARNRINAPKGSHVIIESSTKDVYKAEVIVYIMPIALLIIGYLIASMLGAAEGICVLVAFIALAAGALIVVLTQRNKKGISFEIVGYCND